MFKHAQVNFAWPVDWGVSLHQYGGWMEVSAARLNPPHDGHRPSMIEPSSATHLRLVLSDGNDLFAQRIRVWGLGGRPLGVSSAQNGNNLDLSHDEPDEPCDEKCQVVAECTASDDGNGNLTVEVKFLCRDCACTQSRPGRPRRQDLICELYSAAQGVDPGCEPDENWQKHSGEPDPGFVGVLHCFCTENEAGKKKVKKKVKKKSSRKAAKTPPPAASSPA